MTAPTLLRDTLDDSWGVAPISGVIHHADRLVLRPGGPFATDCGLSKKLAPRRFFGAGDVVCGECQAVWS